MIIRNEFRFTLPKGIGVKTEAGHKATGIMKLVKVKDLVMIERDSTVQKNTAAFYVVLLSKVITTLGIEKSINRNTIEKLHPVDFAFLVDFMHEINHQVLRKFSLTCPNCNSNFFGGFENLGEA